jgi:hypothetical protein
MLDMKHLTEKTQCLCADKHPGETPVSTRWGLRNRIRMELRRCSANLDGLDEVFTCAFPG